MVADARVESLNLEHILPENPTASWNHIPIEVAKSSWKRIGNMVLLNPRVNSFIGAEDFLTIKAPRYREAVALVLTKEVGEASKWDLEEIEARQRRLAKLAIKAWSLR